MKILLLSILLLTTTLFANIGKVTAVKGNVVAIRDAKTIIVDLGFLIKEKDEFKTDKKARVQLQFNDKTTISLGKNSTFNVEEYFFDEKQPKKAKAKFKMAKGVFKSITGVIGKINPSSFKLKTKSASIGIRGTIFFGTIQPGQADNIACTSGSITVTTPAGMVEVPAGQFTTVNVGEAPQPPASIPPAEKTKMEKDSGATDNEQESGQGEQSVEKEKQKSAPQQEPDTTPDTDPTPEPDTPTEVPDVNVEEATDAKDDTNNAIVTPSLKTATYEVFQSGTLTPKNGTALADGNSYYQVLNNNTYFNLTNGVTSGTSQLYAYMADQAGEVIYDQNMDYEADVLDYTLPTYTLAAPSSTYTGYTVYNNGSSTLIVDSKQEFFTGLTSSTSMIEDAQGVDQEYEYQQNLVFGTKSVFNSIPTQGISHYIEPLNTEESNIVGTTNGSYINWASNSLLQYEIRDNDVVIVMGNVEEDEENNARLNLDFYQRKYHTEEDTTKVDLIASDMYLFGSEEQGWGGSIEVAQDNTDNHLVYTHGEIRDTISTSSTPTGSSTLVGFVNVGQTSIGHDLSLTLDRLTGIDATIVTSNGTVTIDGDYASNTAAYITDDTFASLGFSNTGDYIETDNITDGWMIALDTGSLYDDGTDDKISWGFWNMEYTISASSVDIGNQAWVAAQDIVADISTLGNSGTATYSGQAMGFLNGTTFIDPSKSTMNLAFDFGANTLNAELNINNVRTITKNFSTSLYDNSSSSYTGIDGTNEIIGSFANGGATTIGSYTFEDGSDVATGVYKAELESSTLSSPEI